MIFCLRDVHSYWSTPRISHHEIQQLERLKLVEHVAGVSAIRLTDKGAQVKNFRQLKAP